MAAHKIFFHLTWSTYRRQPMIDAATRDFISLAFLRTHVHLLLRTGPRVDLSRLVQFLKGGSSYAASRQPDNVLGLRWNPTYSVASVSPRLVVAAIQYIQNQDQRHPTEVIRGKPIPSSK